MKPSAFDVRHPIVEKRPETPTLKTKQKGSKKVRNLREDQSGREAKTQLKEY